MSEDPEPPATPGDDLEATRAASRRDLHRTSTAMAIILALVFALALAAVVTGIRAARNLQRAEAAEADARERLWNSYVAQARAVRLTPEAGRRQNALNVISNAAAIRATPALRTEAIAALALSDLQVEGPVRPIPRGTEQVEMDTALERYAYGNAQGDVFVCSLTSNETLQTLRAQELGPGTRLPVRSVAFNPDGTKLAVRFDGGAMVIWDLTNGKRLVESGVQATNIVVAGMSFWLDADIISYGDADANGQITVHDFTTRRLLHTALRVGARTFRFRPGTMQVAVVTDNRVDLFDYPSGNKLQTLETATRVFTLAWSPDGEELAATTEDGDIYLWHLPRNQQRVLRGHSEPCIRVGFSPDGALLCSGSRDGTTRLWDVAQGQTLAVANEGLGHVFSREGDRIGFWKPSVGFGTWRLSRSASYRLLVCPKADGAFLSVDLSLDGRWCIATQSKGFRVWDLSQDTPALFVPVGDLQSVRIAPDESALYVCRRSALERWPLTVTESEIRIDASAATPIALPDNQSARAVAISLEGQHALVELNDLRLLVLDLAAPTNLVFLQEKTRTASLRTPGSPTGAGRFAISPDGRWAVTGFGVGAVNRPEVWDAHTGEKVASLAAPSSVVVFSPDGRWLGTAGAASFAIWSVGDWKMLNRFNREEPAITHGSLAFKRNSSEIAVTRTRQQAQLRDAFTDERYADFLAPQLQSVNSIRMALDGSVLVTASATDKLQVWRLDHIHRTLATAGLDWPAPPKPVATTATGKTTPSNPMQTILMLSLAGFGVATVLALLTLRRHRLAIAGYLAAETKAARRNRELEVAKVELMHSQKMQALGTLATGIAHDFNNLLSVIRMSNKLIGRETKANPDIQENVADIEQAVVQGKNVVGSMLGYARADDPAEAADVSAIVEEAVSLLSKEFLSGITLTLELDRSAPPVRVSRGRLEQVLLNLIVNASEAMQGQGRLKITVHQRTSAPVKTYVMRPEEAPQFVELSVQDSGPGIAQEIRDRLFEPFFTTKRSGAKAGTGLGLSLVYSVAQQDNLGLSVESEPGKGAVFCLVIPAERHPPVRETHSSQNQTSPYSGGVNDRN